MGFESEITACGPVLLNKAGGYQYDLVYLRSSNVITICEIKYSQSPVSTSVIAEVEGKIQKTQFPKGYTIEKVLICNQTPSPALAESRYFHRIFESDELLA